MTRLHLIARLLLLIVLVAGPARADDRPTLALALGGGAARGIAHIGALQWLEDQRIPVAGIAGTSMGGLVGGAYAAGLDPDQIAAVVLEGDPLAFFDWETPYSSLDFRGKQDLALIPGPVQTGVFGGPRRGVNPGHRIGLLLSRLAYPVSAVEHFDALPVPFRAVTADIVRGEEVILDDGALHVAMRATMSLPMLFDPIEHDGGLLVDGGALNTVPTDVARAFGTDVVIAIDVSRGLVPIERLGNVGRVLGATLQTPIRQNILAKLTDDDVYVRPAVGDVEPGDFHRAEELIALGYAAMEELEVDLARLRLGEEEYATWKQERRRARAVSAPVDFVEVLATDPAEAREVENALAGFVGRDFGLPELERRLTHLRGRGRLWTLGYRRIERDGRVGLQIVTTGPQSPSELVVGLEIGVTELDEVDLGVRARSSWRDLLNRESELRTSLGVGSFFDLRSELYVPVRGPTFVSAHARYDRRRRAFFVDDDRTGIVLAQRLIGGLDFGLGQNWRAVEFRVGLEADRDAWTDRVGVAPTGTDEGVSLRARFDFDGTDDRALPHRGVRGFVRGRYGLHRSDGPDDLRQGEARIAAWLPVGDHSVLLRVEGGRTLAGNATLRENFTLGGPFRLGTFRPDVLHASNYAYGALGWQHRIVRFGSLASVAVLALVESGAAYAYDADPEFEHAYSLNAIVDLPLGHVGAGMAVGEDGPRAYLEFGKVRF